MHTCSACVYARKCDMKSLAPSMLTHACTRTCTLQVQKWRKPYLVCYGEHMAMMRDDDVALAQQHDAPVTGVGAIATAVAEVLGSWLLGKRSRGAQAQATPVVPALPPPHSHGSCQQCQHALQPHPWYPSSSPPPLPPLLLLCTRTPLQRRGSCQHAVQPQPR